MERLTVIPVVHARLEPAKRVRAALAALRPDAIAIEVPETLASPFARAVARLPLLSILRWREGASGRFAYYLIEPCDAAVEAARFGREHSIEVVCADRDTEGYPGHPDLVPDTWALERLPQGAYDDLVRAGASRDRDPEDERREATMAFHVRRLLDEGRRVALVCGALHADRVTALLENSSEAARDRPLGRTRRAVELFHLHEDASREVWSEPAFLQAAFERWRAGDDRDEPRVGPWRPASDCLAPPEPEPERYQLLGRLARAARRRLHDEDGVTLAAGALDVLLRMARNWSLLDGRLAPDLVQMVTAARGAGGDDYAWRFWELATSWPWQSAAPGLPVLRPTVEELHERAAHLRFRRSAHTRRHRLRLVAPRPREERPGEWKEQWKGGTLVSYPPEDLVLEGYGAFLRRRAVGLLASAESRVVPLTTSLADGIDLRETIRNLAHDGRIFVREDRPVRGDVGSVVLIFDEDEGERRYPWQMTWQGERDDESDMALYATSPGDRMVGPGVGRCEYGGFAMSLPPGRMFRVWEDPFFDAARTRSERLLLAGIDYSLEKMVVYVAARPPRSALAGHAARHGKKLIYVPIGQLSPILLARVRVFHVLDGGRVRAWAKTYIRS